MRIEKLEVHVVAVPYVRVVKKYRPKEPFERPDPIVRVWTDDGLCGIGESGRGGSVEEIRRQFKIIKGKNPLDLYPNDYESGLMQAIYDLQGKALGWPAYRLMGRKVRDKVPMAFWTVELATPEETAAEALYAVERGFKVFKWHTHPTRPETTVERVKAIYDAVGDDLAIRIDRGYPWTFAFTVKIARQIERYNIECFEDPLPHKSVGLYRMLRSKIDIPLAWHIHSAEEALVAVKNEAVDYLNVSAKPDVVSDISAITTPERVSLWLQISGIGCTGLKDAFAAHIGAVTENATLPGDNLHFLKENDLLKPHLKVKDGFMDVPEKPGLGVELDMEAVKDYRIDYIIET